MSYWCAAQLESNRVALATHHLKLSGYRVYAPRLRTFRVSHGGRRVEERPLLFPSYAFVWIDLQWHRARWCCGVVRLIMAGDATPARVPDTVIDKLRASERDGLIDLPKPPRFQRGDKVRITDGPFRARLALYDGQTSSQRVAVLLRLLGGERRIEVPEDAVEPAG